MQAEELPIKYNDEIGAFVDPKTDDKVSQATLLDWAANNPMPTAAIASAPLLSKTVRKGTGKLLKGLLSTLGSSAAGLTFAGMTVKDNLDEGKNIVDATVDPLVGLELLYPTLLLGLNNASFQESYINKQLLLNLYNIIQYRIIFYLLAVIIQHLYTY